VRSLLRPSFAAPLTHPFTDDVGHSVVGRESAVWQAVDQVAGPPELPRVFVHNGIVYDRRPDMLAEARMIPSHDAESVRACVCVCVHGLAQPLLAPH
jgi:hypothetical protein